MEIALFYGLLRRKQFIFTKVLSSISISLESNGGKTASRNVDKHFLESKNSSITFTIATISSKWCDGNLHVTHMPNISKDTQSKAVRIGLNAKRTIVQQINKWK